ncbi:F-box protein SKIP2-like [Ananas comosus]|uniref:F-box protein SKIP2-like n=1 Tax=Ananas comosus TaxID=4615 RepID=A0A6P5EE52_ANACO|nr:F-box protein SKIP2-like [Ananas comosus]
MSGLAAAAPALHKPSVASCSFGASGALAILRGCPLLEELSLKRLRGLDSPLLLVDNDDNASGNATSSSLRSICFKELYNAQCFAPLILGAPNLKSLKLFRCSGDWYPFPEALPTATLALAEVHLEKLQVSDSRLTALALYADKTVGGGGVKGLAALTGVEREIM